VIGRASDYFGPRGVANSHLGGRVIYPALAGRGASLIGQIDLPHTFSYLPDIGRTLVMLGEDEAAYGGVWHLPNPRTVTPRELASMCYTAAGQTPQVSATPKLLLQIGGLFSPMLRELLAEYHQWSVPYIVDDTKFTAAYGDQATPLDQAVEETVAWFRAHPQ
jgi:nucleoside-diphosphate-sugar epimerase